MGTIRKVRSGKIKWGYRFWHEGKLYESIGYEGKLDADTAEFRKREEIGATHDKRKPRAAKSSRFSAAVGAYVRLVCEKHVNYRHEKHAFDEMVTRWGDRYIHTITPDDVEQYKQTLLNRSTGATANRYLAYLTAFFNWAGKRKMVGPDVNPASARLVEREPEPPREHPNITPAIRQKILDGFTDLPIERARLVLMMNLGVRKGVIYRLRWKDVNFDRRTIRYETRKGRRRQIRAFEIPMNDTVQTELKNLRSLYEAVLTPMDEKKARRLGIPRKVFEKIRRFPDIGQRLRLSLTDDGLVFPARTDTTLRRRWAKVKAELGLEGVRLAHDYRVTFAKDLSEAGASIKDIQSLLGHTTPTMTLRYVPVDLEAQRRAVQALDRINGEASRKRRTSVVGGKKVVEIKGKKRGASDS